MNTARPGSPCLTLVVALVCLSGCDTVHRPPRIQASTDDAGLGSAVGVEASGTVIRVMSRSGMGSAQVRLVSGAWPEKLVIQLELKGLEEFRFSYDSVTISASVSSHGMNEVSEALSMDAETSGMIPLLPASPYWMDVTIVSAAGAANERIPLGEGYFSVKVPSAFLRSEAEAFTIAWIDFYR